MIPVGSNHKLIILTTNYLKAEQIKHIFPQYLFGRVTKWGYKNSKTFCCFDSFYTFLFSIIFLFLILFIFIRNKASKKRFLFFTPTREFHFSFSKTSENLIQWTKSNLIYNQITLHGPVHGVGRSVSKWVVRERELRWWMIMIIDHSYFIAYKKVRNFANVLKIRELLIWSALDWILDPIHHLASIRRIPPTPVTFVLCSECKFGNMCRQIHTLLFFPNWACSRRLTKHNKVYNSIRWIASLGFLVVNVVQLTEEVVGNRIRSFRFKTTKCRSRTRSL